VHRAVGAPECKTAEPYPSVRLKERKMENPIVALIHNCGSGLGQQVAHELVARGVTVALYDELRPDAAAHTAAALEQSGGQAIDVSHMPLDPGDIRLNLEAIGERCGRLDALVNLFLPTAETTPAAVKAYTAGLYARGLAAGEVLAGYTGRGLIVNQFFLPSMFADTPLSPHMVLARGAVTSTTRVLCLRHGRAGVRAVGLLAGLYESEETRPLISERVQALTTPLQRWITPQDIAKSIAFLVLDSGYITGQMLVLDGGMTAGVNGI
jgi:pteridine reductase